MRMPDPELVKALEERIETMEQAMKKAELAATVAAGRQHAARLLEELNAQHEAALAKQTQAVVRMHELLTRREGKLAGLTLAVELSREKIAQARRAAEAAQEEVREATAGAEAAVAAKAEVHRRMRQLPSSRAVKANRQVAAHRELNPTAPRAGRSP